jgi:hypothetical protein
MNCRLSMIYLTSGAVTCLNLQDSQLQYASHILERHLILGHLCSCRYDLESCINLLIVMDFLYAIIDVLHL